MKNPYKKEYQLISTNAYLLTINAEYNKTHQQQKHADNFHKRCNNCDMTFLFSPDN
jgi:protein-arginine kinase activator protein McsA